MSTAIVETKPTLPTILGQAQLRIPIGGRIRAGIKVLTKAAQESETVRTLYEQGVGANQPFDAIEQAILRVAPDIKNPLVPKNVPWFTVRPQDFAHPIIASQIMDLYAEDRGDGNGKRLYRFPIVFPSDTWQLVMPHELVAWGANEKKFWSEYSPDGTVRYCMTHAPIPTQNGKRAVRPWGGRKSARNAANEGRCDPEQCPVYQSKKCNLSGRFVFYIPGVASMDAFELPTNSFYAMNAAFQKFMTIAFMRGGRLSGFLDAKRTPFYITKQQLDVPHIDDEGRAVRTKHWIIELEAPVDVTALLRANDDDVVLAQAGQAAHVLEGPARTVEVDSSAVSFHAASVRETQVSGGVAAGQVIGDGQCASSAEQGGSRVPARVAPANTDATEWTARKDASPSFEDVIAVATELGLTAERYSGYADKRWGAGWKANPKGRRDALHELERFRDDTLGLKAKVDAELDDFA